MNISKIIGNFIIKEFENDVPKKGKFFFRKEDKGYSFLEKNTLKIWFVDKWGYLILNEIDNKLNCRQILEEVSKKTKMPYFLLAEFLIRYLKEFKEVNLVQFSKMIKRKSIKGKFKKKWFVAPFQIAVLLTNECNLRCSHCGNENRDRKENELTLEEWYAFIGECSELGVFIFNVSGGEPFMRKDWYEILDYARKKNIEIGITSNGTLIDEKITKQLKNLDIFNIHLSLDGIDKVHDDFRNQKGVFEKVLNSIELLRKNEVPFGITTAISRNNFDNIIAVKNFIKKNKISSWELYSAIPIGCMKKEDALDEKETIELAKMIYDFKNELKETRIFVGDNMGYFDKYNTQEQWEGCRAGITICAIDSEGNIKGCPIHPNFLIEGKVRDKTFAQIWQDKNSFSYNRKPLKLKKHCKKCKYSKICGGGCKASMYS